MGELDKRFGESELPPDEDAPFMEHPTAEFDTTLQALGSAMQRLDRMDAGGRWIDFCGQGQGATPELTHIESVPFCGRTFDLEGQTVDLQPILDSAGLTHAEVKVETSPDGKITLPDASPEQLAEFLDALFQKHFGIKPFEGEDDYAVGAEW